MTDYFVETVALCKKYTDRKIANTISGTNGTITLGTSWTQVGSTDTYTQGVTISGYTVTNNTRVDLISDPAVISQMESDSVEQIYIRNTFNAYRCRRIRHCFFF